MKGNISKNYLSALLIVTSVCLSCTTSNQQAIPSNSAKVSIENKLANKDYSNKPVNIAEENFKKEWQSKYESNVAELEKYRKLWQEKQILNYDFVIAKWAGGVTNTWNRLPVLIKVRNGERVSIEKVEKGDDTIVSKIDGFEEIDTIDKLFAYLHQRSEKGSLIDGKFNKNLSYPQQITISFSFENHGYHNIVIEKFEKNKEQGGKI